MKITAITAFLAALIFALPAFADDNRNSAFPDKSAFHLETAYGMTFVRTEETDLNRHHLYLAPRFSYRDRLIFTPMLRMTQMTLDLREPEKLPADATLTLPWQPSIGIRLRYRQSIVPWFDMSLFAEFEFPPVRNVAELQDFELKEDEKTDIDLDAISMRDGVTVSHNWQRTLVGGTLRFHIGIFRPFIDFGYTYSTGKLVIEFEPDAAELLNSAGVNIDKFYDADLESIYYAVGTEILLPDDFRFRLSATILPTGDRFVAQGEAVLAVPIDFGHP